MLAIALCCVAVLWPAAAGAQDALTPPPVQAEAADPEPAPAEQPATPPADQPDADLLTPRSAVMTFVEAMREYVSSGDRDAHARAIKTLGIPTADAEAGFEEASQLSQVLARIGDLTQIEAWLPDDPSSEADEFRLYPWPGIVPWSLRAGYRPVFNEAPSGQIVLKPNDIGEWRFTPETLASLGAFVTAIEHLPVLDQSLLSLTPAQWIRRHLVPAQLKSGELLRLEYWQWIGIVAILIVGFGVDRVARFVLATIGTFWLRRRGAAPDRTLVANAVQPFGLVAAALIFRTGLDLIGLPATLVFVARFAVTVFLALAAVQAAIRLVDLLANLFEQRAKRSNTRLDDVLVPLFRKVAKVLVVIIAAVSVAEYFDLPYLPLLSGLGIGGLAFAFAAKDTIENFFGSVAVIADRPFVGGDWVVIGNTEGTVESLGLRSTRIRTFYDSQITIPNAELVRARVDNFGRRKIRRFKTTLGIEYNTPPDRIEAFCEGVRELVRQHPYTDKQSFHVWLNGFGPHSLDILVYIFFRTPDWATELRERQRFMLDVLRLAERMNVSFAFPTQTLHVRRPGEDLAAVNPIDDDASAELDARHAGRTLAASLVEDKPWQQRMPDPVRFDAPPPPPVHPAEARIEGPKPRKSLFARRRDKDQAPPS